jgi:hypothetical protein
MKAIRIIGFIVAIGALCYYAYQLFGSPNGKKYKVDDKHAVYYKGDGVTEDDAKKVAGYLKEIGLFGNENEMDVQIDAKKDSKDMDMRFIVDKAKVTPDVESGVVTIGNDMEQKLYPGKTINLILTDSKFDDIKTVGTAKSAQQ